MNSAAGSVVCESSTVECETRKLLCALALLILSWTASPDGNNRAGMLSDFELPICCLIVCHHPRPPISSNSKLLICLFSYASLDKAKQWTYSFRILRYFDHASLLFFNLACLNSLSRWRLLERRRLVYHGWSPCRIVTILLGMNCLARLVKDCVMREVISLTFCRSRCACQSWFMIVALSPSQSASEYSHMCRDKVVLGGRSIQILQEIWQRSFGCDMFYKLIQILKGWVLHPTKNPKIEILLS